MRPVRVLIIEIVAGRILAPTISVSLYTWTSVIGVVLAGIAVGNYVGGLVADRFPSQTTLGLILLAGGVSSLSVLSLVDVASEAFGGLPLVVRIIFVTATLFFLPSLILGMVTPVVIKIRLHDLAQTGNVVGKIYAVSTAGSIFGTFITGFVLIQWVGTRPILFLVSLVLLFMAVAFGNLWKVKMPGLSLLVLFIAIWGVSYRNGAFDSECLEESNYFCIRVTDLISEGGKQLRVLHLDKFPHSYVALEDPTFLHYGYQKVLADLTNYGAEKVPDLRLLGIGGGGYTTPGMLR